MRPMDWAETLSYNIEIVSLVDSRICNAKEIISLHTSNENYRKEVLELKEEIQIRDQLDRLKVRRSLIAKRAEAKVL